MKDLKNSVIEILREKREYVNGERIASKLDVSRVSISKTVKNLKEDGYIIDSKPGVGYKLKRIELSEISSYIDKKAYYFSEVPSTQSVAQDLAEKGIEEALVVSEIQKNGRGRRNRSWQSSRGGLWFTLILRPNEPPSKASFLNIIAGLSVAKAIEDILDIHASLKWPNDVLLDEKKVCGILSEMKGEVDHLDYVLLGVGLNVNNNVSVEGSTSLSEIKSKRINRTVLLKAIIRNFEDLMDEDRSRVVDSWESRSSTIGKRVEVQKVDGNYDGLAEGIDENGALIVTKDNGEKESVLSGDVIHLR